MEVVLGEVAGIEICGGVDFCSSKTCLVVMISLGGMGCVGSWTTETTLPAPPIMDEPGELAAGGGILVNVWI
jgi:hypothetical protein